MVKYPCIIYHGYRTFLWFFLGQCYPFYSVLDLYFPLSCAFCMPYSLFPSCICTVTKLLLLLRLECLCFTWNNAVSSWQYFFRVHYTCLFNLWTVFLKSECSPGVSLERVRLTVHLSISDSHPQQQHNVVINGKYIDLVIQITKYISHIHMWAPPTVPGSQLPQSL